MRIIVVVLVSLSMVLVGCGSTTSGPPKIVKAALCIAGGYAGSRLGDKLAEKFIERSGEEMSAQEAKELSQTFQIGFFLAFCAIANYAGETVYKNLSQEGQEKRKEQVLLAASSAQPTTYRDPNNPNLRGTVTVLASYQEESANRECFDMEDTLTDGTISGTAYTKVCRELPDGTLTPVTS